METRPMRNHQENSAAPRKIQIPRRAVELVYRYQPGAPGPAPPATSGEALARLSEGNENLARFIRACRTQGHSANGAPAPVLLHAHAVGQGPDAAGFPRQEPFALVLGCADARTPAEITFCQSFNDLFNVRVAGNVLGVECAGSVRYALDHFAPCTRPAAGNAGSLRLMLALGHLNCGAVKAAVDAYQGDLLPDLLPDSSVGAILQRIQFPALMTAVEAFDTARGLGAGASRDRRNAAALADLVVALNAAWTAHALRELIPADPVTQRSVAVVYGVFDPRDGSVSAGPCPRRGSGDRDSHFATPPRDLKDLRELAGVILAELPEALPSDGARTRPEASCVLSTTASG
jgi:carbonic anhydrase